MDSNLQENVDSERGMKEGPNPEATPPKVERRIVDKGDQKAKGATAAQPSGSKVKSCSIEGVDWNNMRIDGVRLRNGSASRRRDHECHDTSLIQTAFGDLDRNGETEAYVVLHSSWAPYREDPVTEEGAMVCFYGEGTEDVSIVVFKLEGCKPVMITKFFWSLEEQLAHHSELGKLAAKGTLLSLGKQRWSFDGKALKKAP